MKKIRVFIGLCLTLLLVGSGPLAASADETGQEIEDCFLHVDGDSYNVLFDNGDIHGLTVVNNGEEVWSSGDSSSWRNSSQYGGYFEAEIAPIGSDLIAESERSHFSLRTFNAAGEQSEKAYCGHLDTTSGDVDPLANPASCSVEIVGQWAQISYPTESAIRVWANGTVVLDESDFDPRDRGDFVRNDDGLFRVNITLPETAWRDTVHYSVQNTAVEGSDRTYCGKITL